MKKRRATEPLVNIAVRVPQALYDDIKTSAEAACRTMGNELRWRLEFYAEQEQKADKK